MTPSPKCRELADKIWCLQGFAKDGASFREDIAQLISEAFERETNLDSRSDGLSSSEGGKLRQARAEKSEQQPLASSTLAESSPSQPSTPEKSLGQIVLRESAKIDTEVFTWCAVAWLKIPESIRAQLDDMGQAVAAEAVRRADKTPSLTLIAVKDSFEAHNRNAELAAKLTAANAELERARERVAKLEGAIEEAWVVSNSVVQMGRLAGIDARIGDNNPMVNIVGLAMRLNPIISALRGKKGGK